MNVARLKALFVEYGNIALWTYFALFLVVLTGFALAIQAGFDVDSAPGGVGVLGAAYVATKVTQPIRIGLSLLLTPFVARVVRRRRAGKSNEDASSNEDAPSNPDASSNPDAPSNPDASSNEDAPPNDDAPSNPDVPSNPSSAEVSVPSSDRLAHRRE